MMKKIVLGGLEGRMGSFLVEALKEEEDICLVAGISEKENFEGEVPIYSDINQVKVNYNIFPYDENGSFITKNIMETQYPHAW